MGETFHTSPLLASLCPRFAGKDSAADLHRYHFDDVSNVPAMIGAKADAWEDNPWKTGRDDAAFYGTRDMAEAFKLAREGWREGADAAHAAWAGLEAAMPQARRQVVHGFSGSSVNVARMLAGQPRYMRRRAMADAPVRPILTLIANASAPSYVQAADMLQHAIAQAAVVDMLEARGYRVGVVYLKRARNGNDTFGYELALRAKAPDMPRNLAMLTFVLGHPGMYRRLGFGVMCSRPECKPLGTILGYPVPVEQKLAKPGTYIMPGQQVCEEGTGAVERFRAVVRALGKADCPGIPEGMGKAA